MSLSNLPFFPQSVNTDKQTIVNSDAQTVKTISTAGTNGSKVSMLLATSTDTSNRDVILYHHDLGDQLPDRPDQHSAHRGRPEHGADYQPAQQLPAPAPLGRQR